MIYGERIRFRHAEREDLPVFVAWLNDPELRHGIFMHLPMSLAREEAWFEEMIKRPLDEQILVIEIKRGKDWKAIGTCSYHKVDWRVRSAEVGIMIGEKDQWDKGYGTETIRLLIKHGFETLNLNRIDLQVYDDNPRAIRAYEKAGFVHEGRLRQAQYIDGRYVDVLRMSVLRSEWELQK
ncbi:MAG: N-acetyltransferase [Chloroflexi bacterium]|nr:GNAT family protein [Chloroflexota bacterium]MQC26994.1 N-acetyltransferase [Chloroflexota bacterium]